jgi:hypothetical protein
MRRVAPSADQRFVARVLLEVAEQATPMVHAGIEIEDAAQELGEVGEEAVSLSVMLAFMRDRDPDSARPRE